MPCAYITPAKGHQKPQPCKEPELAGGFCAKRQPPKASNVAKPVDLSRQPMPAAGTTVNPVFQNTCDLTEERIDTICGNGAHPGGTTFTGSKGTFQLLHDTQPGANNAIFYKWVGNVMMVYGVGGHTGQDNKHYSLTWYDGSTVAVSLPKKQIGGRVVHDK